MSGPMFCKQCGKWPVSNRRDQLCNICDDIAWCVAHPVPLPRDPKMRRDIEVLRSMVKQEPEGR